jgi:hypothetical protein
MPKTLRIPITNVCDGSDYSAQILVGSEQVVANVILDTGSSTLAIDPSIYNPATDANVTATSLAQLVIYGTGGWLGPVVNTSMILSQPASIGQPGSIGHAAGNVTLKNSPIAVTDFQASDNFTGTVDGIMGLAYYALNDAYNLEDYLKKSGVNPPATWPWPFPSGTFKNELQAFNHLVGSARVPSVDIQPYFNELLEHDLTLNKFAFYTLRSWVHMASNNQNAIARDPLNQGIFVLGGGEQEKDLYAGSFVHVDVLHDVYYNTNLIAIQVEGCAEVPARPLQSHFKRQDITNSIMDTGTSALYLAYDVFRAVLASFESLNLKFTSMIRLATTAADGISVSLLDLAEWPDLHFILTGADGKPVRLTCSPGTYWQVNYPAPGFAAFQIAQNSTENQANQSILGLPLFNNYYTVFDRSQGKGNGVISVAPIARR